MTTIVVVSAGHSVPSSTRMLANALSDATLRALSSAGIEARSEVIELRELATDLANQSITRFASGRLQKCLDAVSHADGVIAVSPIYNGSYSGLFKLFFDALDEDSLTGRPVLLAATGGTPRHSLAIDHAMLPLFYYLRATVVPYPVFAATEDWGSKEGKLERHVQRSAKAFATQMASGPDRASEETPLKVVDLSTLLNGN